MISHFLRLSRASVALLTTGLAAVAIAPLVPPISVALGTAPPAQYPDTENHWAQPFIAVLTEQGILTGYPDGTFRPDQAVGRDEFAAVLRQAFNQPQERQLASGSVYRDVPVGYWAAQPIEEAYQMGFMKGYPGGYFRPEQEVTRVEALVSLAQNLSLENTASAESGEPPAIAVPATTSNAANTPSPAAINTQTQPNSRQTARRRYMYPMAMTALMQPLITAPVRAGIVPTNTANEPAPAESPMAQTEAAPATTASTETAPPLSVTVDNYYRDADRIPQYAVDEVANATKAGIVVNYPDPTVLNPTAPATRGEIAAFIHQALVNQDRLAPLSDGNTAKNYVIEGR